ncbi:HNH endonuclease family protein [Roseibium sp. TrichSKD4]|uniref:HNH endonuclease n=1 Tax=Roseibium sp. TrichSKD4 TaxID=744980 RepID=UPI0001E56943|nr:HNH endonuclease [Roseibium sp. TrichSKD4]EFO31808.1 HNH endonuclease family protein [Roseibium sp. TrichSKD4]
MRHGFYYADIENYLNFDQPVSCAQNGGFEPGFINEKGEINPGYRVQSVRVIDRATFVKIIEAGLSDDEDWPDRVDPPQYMDTVLYASDNAQAPLFDAPGERPIIAQILNRPFRDKKFRQQIRKLYDRTCAFTGLRLINGKGRPEVEACHIKPVEDGGNDSVQNGIALSGTVHWMFDRGLLSLSDHYDILISRHLNYDVSHLLNKNLKAKVPTNPEHRPHPHYLAYHRDTKFKL